MRFNTLNIQEDELTGHPTVPLLARPEGSPRYYLSNAEPGTS